MSKNGDASPAPIEYIEMVVLPSRGWSYSEVKKLTLAERHNLLLMLELMADPRFAVDRR